MDHYVGLMHGCSSFESFNCLFRLIWRDLWRRGWCDTGTAGLGDSSLIDDDDYDAIVHS